MNVLVLGANGFLGSSIINSLLEKNVNIHAFDTSFDNIHDIKNITKHKGNFFDIDEHILINVDVIYFCIGTTNITTTWEYPKDELNKNIIPILNVLEYACKYNVKKFVFASSGGAIYGNYDRRVSENDVIKPYTPYSITKATIEYYLDYYKEKYGLQYDVYRIGNIYGINQNTNNKQGLIQIWMNKIKINEPIDIYDYSTVRDYIWVNDASTLMMHSISSLEKSDTFNIGTGIGTSNIDIFKMIKQITNKDIKINLQDRRVFDISSNILDISKILKLYPNFKFAKLEIKIKEMWKKYIDYL